MLWACYWKAMANLQVKDVPAALHRKLRAQARRQGRTMRDLILEAVRREVEREDFRLRLLSRRPVDLGRSAATSLDEVRDEREGAIGR
jgi:plasmid stability protein